jgi:hypothetical protein
MAADATQLVLIPQPHVAQTWPLARPYLAQAAMRGRSMQDAEEWLGECINDAKQLWLLWDEQEAKCRGAVVTYLTRSPSGMTCVINAFGAESGTPWPPLLSVLEDWARTQNCTRIRIYGRVGWTEKLPNYALKGVILDRNL